MFVHNINPNIFSIGFLHVRYYGIAYIIGFLIAYFVLKREAKIGWIKNLNKERVDDLFLWIIVGVIVGGRLGYVLFYNLGYYLLNPVKILFIWEGGMSFHGGLIGVVLVGILFCKKYKIRFYQLGDPVAVWASLIFFLGRIANFINGELWGRVTNVPWCVKFKGAEGCRHPSQLYEALKNLIMFPFLIWFYPRNRKKEGLTFWLFMGLYGIGRFVVDFYRVPDPTDPVFLGISIGQYLSLFMFITAVIVIVLKYVIKKDMKKKKAVKKRKTTSH